MENRLFQHFNILIKSLNNKVNLWGFVLSACSLSAKLRPSTAALWLTENKTTATTKVGAFETNLELRSSEPAGGTSVCAARRWPSVTAQSLALVKFYDACQVKAGASRCCFWRNALQAQSAAASGGARGLMVSRTAEEQRQQQQHQSS